MYDSDPFDDGTPKYATAQDIYDGLCTLVETEEINILSEMFPDVSYENQEYYYTFHGTRLKEQFESMTDYCENLWIMDLAIFQIDRPDVHDFIWEALHNTDLDKRIGFKKLFVDHMLHGDTKLYEPLKEANINELEDFGRFDYYAMFQAFRRAMHTCGREVYGNPYSGFCHALYEKICNLRLQKETQLIAECRALLTSYDDFLFGLRANQHLYEQLERQYNSKVSQLQANYTEKLQRLIATAKQQGVILEIPKELEKPALTETASESITEEAL